MNILLPGQYPRSENLVAATRDFDRGRITKEARQKVEQDDLQAFIALQKGLPYLSPGLFGFQDLLRPFIEILDHVNAGTLTRFYETNTFWRMLESDGVPSLRKEKIEGWFAKHYLGSFSGSFSPETPLLITLPFLYLFKDYSKGISLETIASALESVAQHALARPNTILCFFEPTFGWRKLSHQELERGKKLLLHIAKSGSVYLCSFFFSLARDLDIFFEMPVDGFGIDFYANSVEETMQKFPKNKTLLAGIINTDSTLIESQARVEEFLRLLGKRRKFYLTPNAPAELLPRSVMDKKVKNLIEILHDTYHT